MFLPPLWPSGLWTARELLTCCYSGTFLILLYFTSQGDWVSPQREPRGGKPKLIDV